MKNKIIKIAIIGRTNAGKSTFINSLIGEKISIENKKINTTRELTAGIINLRNEWPLDNRHLYRFVESKYGLENVNNIHHYETKEVKDSKGRTILPAGKKVDSTFSMVDPDNANKVNITPNPVIGVTNWEYETLINEDKRSIYLLRREYLQMYLNDMREIMHYDKSSQFVNRRLVETENTRNTSS